ncbi:CDP-diacylglycerol pyrophosphatase [Cupriavidus laharis]|uniref:CDP-diacylglycerol pyrophosphatase n=1 Tax=Cupriavidus laharis TaxID=151654 RepID=A0ABM8XRM4_9BURK|nr:CDP-diacylglycerol diphosphatase [Cupriavidus laharis]CAG9182922.1 CDP-diacylglycerol pyrophosphatase [Cupriavidus laharis]
MRAFLPDLKTVSRRPWLRRGMAGAALVALSTLALTAQCHQEDLWLPGITRDSLWQHVQERCLVTEQARHADCAVVDRERGLVLYKDAIGASHYLVIPDHKVTGVDDPALWEGETRNQWAFGWEVRGIVGKAIGKHVPDDLVGLAVNSRASRSQDQLHIHLDCISEAARAFIADIAGKASEGWANFRFQGKPVRAVLIPSSDSTMRFNAFNAVRKSLAEPERLADRGVFVTYVMRQDGPSGFMVVDQPVDAASGSTGHASDFLDRACRLGRALQ